MEISMANEPPIGTTVRQWDDLTVTRQSNGLWAFDNPDLPGEFPWELIYVEEGPDPLLPGWYISRTTEVVE